MITAITKKEQFKAKDGREYVKLHYLSANGEVGEVFTSLETFQAFRYNETKIQSPETLTKVLDLCDTTIVEFDNKGRVTALQ